MLRTLNKLTNKPLVLLSGVLLIGIFIFFPLLLVLLVMPFVLYNSYQLFKTGQEQSKIKNFTPRTEEKLFDMLMSHEDKLAYMNSDKWSLLRQQVLQRDNHTCQSCGNTHNLQIHHITYERLGDETLDQLVTLCGICHTNLHDKLGYSRRSVYPISTLKDTICL